MEDINIVKQRRPSRVDMKDLMGVVMLMLTIGVAAAIGIQVNTQIGDDVADCFNGTGYTENYGTNGEALNVYNATGRKCHNATAAHGGDTNSERPNNPAFLAGQNGTESIGTVAENLPTLALVLIMSAILIALVVFLFRRVAGA